MALRSIILFQILLVEVVIECCTPLELMCAIDSFLTPTAIHCVIFEVVLLHLLPSPLNTIISLVRRINLT
jgi:hypothetical protein